jgi:hypothetical protein
MISKNMISRKKKTIPKMKTLRCKRENSTTVAMMMRSTVPVKKRKTRRSATIRKAKVKAKARRKKKKTAARKRKTSQGSHFRMSQSMNQSTRRTPDSTRRLKLLVHKQTPLKLRLLQLSHSLQRRDPTQHKDNNLTNNRILRSSKRNNKRSKLKSK